MRKASKLPLRILLAALVAYLVCDIALLRSGFYYRLVEPESTAGSTLHALLSAEKQRAGAARAVLVIGDSRIGEGFSARLATETAAAGAVRFVALPLPGSTPRVWDYTLRAMGDHLSRYAAVVVMANTLDDRSEYEDLANREIDLAYLAPLIGVADLHRLPASFSDPAAQWRARKHILLPAQALRQDALALLGNPYRRARQVYTHRRDLARSQWSYEGRPQSLPPSPGAGRPSATDDLAWRTYFLRLQGRVPTLPAATARRYRAEWYGALAARATRVGAPLLVVPVPRGPYHAQSAKVEPLHGALAELQDAGRLTVLDRMPYRALEQPGYFFDSQHLNRRGRERFSRALAQQVLAQLEARGGR
jgi:hypothetical protein